MGSATSARDTAAVDPSAVISKELKISSGALRGTAADEPGVLAFKGIPFAKPPVGDLRWRAPQPVEPWTGVRDATQFGLRCPAVALGGPARLDTPASEDCLTLNVWTGAQTVGEKRPVMVWIHGGGFQFGAAHEPNTDGARFAAKGVVLVSIEYRLGILGFLTHPDLDREGGLSGNFGLQDQIAALGWVRDNIARFGGDPDNVTIFGESAGAHSVGLLMTSPPARGLFHRAIMESGAWWDGDTGSIQTRAEALARGIGTLDQLADGDLAKARTLPADDLVKQTGWGVKSDPVSQAFSPHVDGHILPEAPASAFARGAQAQIPMLAGWNGSEGYIFRQRMPADPDGLKKAASERFGADRLDEFFRDYPVGNPDEAAQSAERLIGDLVIRGQIWEALRVHGALPDAATYGYAFEYRSGYSPVAAHSADIDFVFGSLKPQHFFPSSTPPTVGDRAMSDVVMGYWINFARTGNPNGAGLPDWPAYDADAGVVMTFDTAGASVKAEDDRGMALIASFRRDGRMPASWRRADG